MYGDLHEVNDNLSENSEDDDIVNNPDDLVQSDVEEIPIQNNVSDDEAANDAEGGETENKDKEGTKVEPKRKRVLNPQPKLNDQRLKGPRGIGVVEDMFKDIKIRGKGYEKEDLDIVMGQLEHWTHRLFPKFQFDDCLQRIEKLGSKRIVSNYIKRIRLGMEDEVVNEIVDPPSPEPTVDPFDELIGQRQEVPQVTKKSITLTAEQRERMLRNRMIAEERRMARLQVQKEKEAQSNNNTEREAENSVSSQNIPQGEQTDLSENCGEVCRETAIEEHDGTGASILTSVENINLADSGDTEIIGHANKDINISHTTDMPLEEEEPPNDRANVSEIVSEPPVISDHDSQNTMVMETVCGIAEPE